MKRLASIFLCLVLVFSFSVTSFAYDSVYETDIVNLVTDIWLSLDGVYGINNSAFAIMQDVDNILNHSYNSLLQLMDINEFTRLSSEYDSEIFYELHKINNNLFGGTVWLESLGDIISDGLSDIQSDLDALVEVLADPDDVALKESQKNNQEAIQDNFFTPGNDTSIDMGKISNVADLSSDFLSAFDTSKVVGNSNPLELIGTGSDFSRWFSSENGQAMDPEYGIGSGGGGSNVPLPPSGPVYQGTNVLPYAVSNLVTGTIYNGKGFKNYSAFGQPPFPENDSYSDFYSTTGYIELSADDVLYAVNMDFSDGVMYQYYGASDSKSIEHFYGIDLNDFIESTAVDENGVFSWSFTDMERESLLAVRFESALISPATYITINEYPLANVEPPEEPEEPEPEPIKNWLPLATTEPGGSEIYNGKGWKENTRWSNSGQAPSSSPSCCLSGWIPCSSSDVLYLYNLTFSGSSSQYVVGFEDGSSFVYPSSGNASLFVPDSNGVISLDLSVFGRSVSYFRVSATGISSESVISINQYPIPESNPVSTFSVRASAPNISYSEEVVTSYYQDRMNEFYNLLGGLNNG